MAEAAGTDGATVDTIYPITGKKYKFMVKHIFWKDHVTNCELCGSLERMPTAIRPYGMEELHYPGMFFVLAEHQLMTAWVSRYWRGARGRPTTRYTWGIVVITIESLK